MNGTRGIIGRAAGLGLLAGLAGLALCLWPAAPAAGDVIGQWSTATLSQGRYGIAATSVGGMAFFAGGTAKTGGSNVVDIYNSATGSWSTGPALWTRHLSAPPQATSTDGKALFTQGFDLSIYDTATAQWSSTVLPHSHSQGAVASAGGLVFFGGGNNYSTTVDIYNPVTGAWSSGNLSAGRYNLLATSGGGKVFFAGGTESGPFWQSDRVDIFNTVTGVWSLARLSEARLQLSATSAGGKILFAGGVDNAYASDVVDIYDFHSGTWSTTVLPEARSAVSATSLAGLALFAGGWDPWNGHVSNELDIFDTAMGTWSTGLMPAEFSAQGATSIGNQAFFAGGGTNSTYYSNSVYIYTVPEPGIATLFALGGLLCLLAGWSRRRNDRLTMSGSLSSPSPAGPLVEPLEKRVLLSGIAWSLYPNHSGGLYANQIKHAYGFDEVSGGFAAEGLGQTIAIVVAYDAPNIADDLGKFSEINRINRDSHLLFAQKIGRKMVAR